MQLRVGAFPTSVQSLYVVGIGEGFTINICRSMFI
jgi:hypothetical protein